jgi:hypothetical protein
MLILYGFPRMIDVFTAHPESVRVASVVVGEKHQTTGEFISLSSTHGGRFPLMVGVHHRPSNPLGGPISKQIRTNKTKCYICL